MAWIATLLFFHIFIFFDTTVFIRISCYFIDLKNSLSLFPLLRPQSIIHYHFFLMPCCIAFVRGPRETVPNPEEAIASLYFTDYPQKFGKKEPVAQQFLREFVYSWAVTQPSRCPTRGCLSRQTTTHRPTCDFVLITASMESLSKDISLCS